MKLTVESQDPANAAVDLLGLPLASLGDKPRLGGRAAAVDRKLDGQIQRALRAGDFKGKRGETLLLYGPEKGGPRRVLLIGLGDDARQTADTLRQAAGRAVGAAAGRGARSVAIAVAASRPIPVGPAAQAMAEGAILAGYRSDTWRTRKEDAKPPVARVTLLVDRPADVRTARSAAAEGVQLAECQNVARQLSNEPPNLLTPATLARHAQKVAREVGLGCRVLDVAELKRLKAGAMLAVGQGSANPPRLVVLEHKPRGSRKKQPTVCVVGKGITFDSGGISIKPSGGMHDMKHDMAGAAAVVGILRAAAVLELPLHVVGLLAAAENMPGGGAYRPGDILTSMSGQTIEIQNTDAEGRLVLADALHYARTTFEPVAMFDLATLTGAAVVALGSWCCGVFGSHEGLVDAVRQAGETTGERAWPMPLYDEHREAMRSQIADLKNVSGSRDAGACTAAGFLSRFVGDVPWVHLDIAGTAWANKPDAYQPHGATGYGVRLLTRVLADWSRVDLS